MSQSESGSGTEIQNESKREAGRETPPANSFEANAEAVYAFAGVFFEGLTQAGMTHVVISPGSRSTPLAISADRTRGLRTWVELDERSAAFFALGLAKATGRPAALVCTSGTAAANYLPAVIEAHYSRVPLIVLSADRPPELRDWGAGQAIEQHGLYGRYPRWAAEVPIPESGAGAIRFAAQLAARAVECAVGGESGRSGGSPAGAVHLNWPLREPLAPPAGFPNASAGSAGNISPPHFSHSHAVADAEDIADLVKAVRTRERGVLCAGPMDAPPDLGAALIRFSHASGWPLLADPASSLRSVEPEAGAPILDCGDLLTRAPRFTARMQPDFVLRIGEPPVSKAQRLWIEVSEPSEIWWLDEGLQWGEPSHRATRIVRGGAVALLNTASEALAKDALRNRSWCQDFERANAAARASVEAHAADDEAWSGVPIAAALTSAMPEGGALFSSNSMSIRLLELAYSSASPAFRILCSRGASGIDGINSTALGVAAGLGKPTALLTGDLAFLHDLSGLLLARREELPLTFVVIDDNGGGIFSFLPVAEQGEGVSFEQLFHTPHDVDLGRVASLFELDYHRADSLDELNAALTASLRAPGISVVHARVDSVANAEGFREIVRAGVAAVDAIFDEPAALGSPTARGSAAVPSASQ